MPPAASADLPVSKGSRRGIQESIAVQRNLSSRFCPAAAPVPRESEGADGDWGTGLGLRRGHLTADPAMPRVRCKPGKTRQDLQDEFSSILKVLPSPSAGPFPWGPAPDLL